MDFVLLGPMTATRRGEPLDLGRRGQRLVLALLLLEANHPVQADRLRALLWGDEPPENATGIVQTHVSRLRRLLDPARDGQHGFRLLTQGNAYQAETEPDTVDVHRFRRLAQQGLALTDPSERVAALRQALRLWRGPLLADIADDDLRHRVGAGLAELRLATLEACGEAELAAGRHRTVIAELTGLVADHPTRESMVGQLMLALYRDGRGPDALDLYHRTRRTLAGTWASTPVRDSNASTKVCCAPRRTCGRSVPEPPNRSDPRSCRRRPGRSSAGSASWRSWTACSPRPPCHRSPCWSAPRVWARPRWRCAGPTGSGPLSGRPAPPRPQRYAATSAVRPTDGLARLLRSPRRATGADPTGPGGGGRAVSHFAGRP